MSEKTNQIQLVMSFQEKYADMLGPWTEKIDGMTQAITTISETIEPYKKLQEQLRSSMAHRTVLIDSLGLAVELSESIKDVYKDQVGIIAALETMAKTSEILGLQKELISNNLLATGNYIADVMESWNAALGVSDLIKRGIPAQNIALLKLLEPMADMALPYGGKTVIRSLTKGAATELSKTNQIMFDPERRDFYHVDTPEQKINADEISVAESSLELFSEISFSDLVSFESQLFEDTTFALEHPVGKKIYEIISSWKGFITFDQSTYFHARKIGKDGQPFLEHEMLKAPINISGHGRYNAIGKSCYYFADSERGAASEIKKHCGKQKTVIQIAEIKPTKTIKILDLSKQISKNNKFMEHMRYTVENDDGKIIKQYLLPNFVASCCKRLGIEGIKYLSGDYCCYVTWKDDYFDFVNQKIVEPD